MGKLLFLHSFSLLYYTKQVFFSQKNANMKSIIANIQSIKVPRLLKNKYVLVLLAAAVWMTFFDKYSAISQFKMRDNIAKLQADKEMYQMEILDSDYEISKIKTDKNEVERYAREHYWLKKDNEDVFIIVEE